MNCALPARSFSDLYRVQVLFLTDLMTAEGNEKALYNMSTLTTQGRVGP